MNFIRKHLSAKIASLCVMTAVLICTAVCVSGFFQYRKSIYNDYQIMAYNIASIAESYVDGDTIVDALDNGGTNPEYISMVENLYNLYKKSGISSVYIAIPDKNNLVNGNPTITNLFDVHIVEATEDIRPYYEIGVIDEIKVDHPEYVFDVYYTGELNDDYFVTKSKHGYNTNSVLPIVNSEGVPQAILVVSVPMSDIESTLSSFVVSTILITVAIIALCITAFIGLLYHSVTKPVEKISKETEAFTKNNAQVSEVLPKIRQTDEIGNLAKSIYKMEKDINEYIANITSITAEKERIGAELDVARHIQASSLPFMFPAFPDRKEFDIFASMTPAKEVGGDFYDFFLIDDNHLALVMADVSGKGVPAAMFMMISKIFIKSAAQSSLSPKAILEKVNNQLCENNDAGMFVTVWLGILEISTGKLKCANAGHEFPSIMRKDGNFELFTDKHGFVLAGMEGSRYKEYDIELNEGDRLFVYTDGVPEATNSSNVLFGTDRMLESLNKYKGGTCKDILTGVHEDIDEFVGAADQFDDITMLCVEMNGTDDGMKKMNIEPSLDKLTEATAFFEDTLSEADAPMKLIAQVNIVVDEIFSNIARYSGATLAILGCSVNEDEIVLRFSDNGNQYDPTEKDDPDVTLSAEDRQIGGLGIFMVKKMMDEVEYTYKNGLNILTLKKKLK